MRSILAFFLIAIATIASSQDDDPFDITLYGSFLHTATVPNALFFSTILSNMTALSCVEHCEIMKSTQSY